MYYRESILTEVKKSIKWMLAGIRFLVTFLIALLLIGLIFENFVSKKEKPLLFIAQDNSESIVQTKDSTSYRTDYLVKLKGIVEKLSEKFEVIPYAFGESVSNGIEGTYTNKLTDMSGVLNQIYDQYSNRNIGAIVLSTDGIYNKGANPIYTISRKPYVPVFAIGQGDTSSIKDVLINEIIHNEIAFLGNEFPVEISVKQDGFKGQDVNLSVFENDKLLMTKSIAFEQVDEIVKQNISIKAKATGFRKYTVKVSPLDGEFTLKNNVRNFYINVIDGRQKILLTYSGTHPDVAAINYVIENNKNYELTVKTIDELDEDLNKYDLIIIHNYQKGINKDLEDIVNTNRKPVFHIIGVNSDFQALSKANIGFSGQGGKSEDVTFLGNSNFNDIIYESEIFKNLGDAPPLKSPMGNIKFSAGIKILAYQKIGSIDLTKPLIYFSEKSDNKYCVVFGEGLWRWRLFDQMKNESTKNFENFISKMINYLAIKDNKDPFKIDLDNEFEESENVVVRAELYNASYELINSQDVSFVLTDDENKTLDYNFYKTTNAYKLELGRLGEGVYNWVAKTELNGENYVKKGTFLVKEIKRELLNLTANHRLLKNMAENTNGQFYLPNQLETLENELLNRSDIVPVVYQEKSFDDFIDYKWMFFLIIILLSGEWFIRKFQGGY